MDVLVALEDIKGQKEMRKVTFIFIAVTLAVSATAQTQQGKEVKGQIQVVPKLFTYGGNACLAALSDEEDSQLTFDIYNDDIEKVRSISVSGAICTYRNVYQQRKAEAKATTTNDYQVYYDVLTYNQAKEWAANGGADEELEAKDGYEFWPTFYRDYYGYEQYGETYPDHYFYWNPSDGYIYRRDFSYTTAYTGEWETIEDYSWQGGNIMDYDFLDYDDGSYPDWSFSLSQTLFNTDEKFEYLVPAYEEYDGVTGEYDRDYDGVIDQRTIYYGVRTVGFSIVNEDGKTLQTVRTDGDLANPFIMKIGGKLYLGFDTGDEAIFYRIDQQGSSVEQVANMPLSARAIYSLDGRRLPHARHGMNIIRKEDGRVTKHLVR